MSKRNWNQNQHVAGAEIPAEPEVQSTEPEAGGELSGEQLIAQEVVPEAATIEEQLEAQDAVIKELDEGEPQSLETLPKVTTTMGIGQFVRHLLLKSTKTNAEILSLVSQHFPESKTTPACIAWYKSDLRKKGLLEGGKSRGAAKIVVLSAEDLAELVK